MAEEYGSILGQAVKIDYDQQVNDLFRYDEMRKRTQAMNESKAKLFAEDMEFQNAMNEYDNPRVKEFAASQINKIGQFMRNNPDYASNPIKMGQIKVMKNELKSNPALLRGLAVDKAHKEYLADLQESIKAPNQWDTEALKAEGQKFQNYFKTGNARGLEGLQQEGEQPVVYTRPREFINLPETLLKSGQMINPSMVTKGKNLGEYTRTADPNHVSAIKASIWKENGRQIDVEAKKLGLNTPEQVDKWLTDGIMAGVKTTYDPGDLNALWERGMREREFNQRQGKLDAKANIEPAGSPYYTIFEKNKPSGNIPADVAPKIWGDTPKLSIAGNTGSQVDLTGYKMNYDNRYLTDGSGQRRLTGFVDVPIADAKKFGIYSDSGNEKTTVDGVNYESNKDSGITGEFLGKATVRSGLNAKGETEPSIVRIYTSVPINKNDDAAKQFYDSHVQPSKLTNPLEDGSGNSQQAQVTTYEGRKVGSIVKTTQGDYLVTAQGYVKQ